MSKAEKIGKQVLSPTPRKSSLCFAYLKMSIMSNEVDEGEDGEEDDADSKSDEILMSDQ
ncbi:hypothetical protein SLEP1_g21310 [Rubroshorea leprosula]|uniref:Uncharacterized protein n=1 Tax=Rubroshorea leprosula TaxID=152421 RepID=A0AAV5JBL5_9ROSI|nr:hypothetical protein SLEP1_g21310 [Rubroshorea leprosula]